MTRSAWDSNFVKANTKFLAVAWESGGGSVAIFRHEDSGKVSQANPPLLSGHKRAVLDFDFHPFNENLIATVSEVWFLFLFILSFCLFVCLSIFSSFIFYFYVLFYFYLDKKIMFAEYFCRTQTY